MSRQIQIRRGTAAENDAFTGAIGEVTMDTTNKTLRIHDGETPGGTVLAKQSEIPNFPADMDYVIESQLPTAENNYTWYRKYKSGWVEQGGRVAGASSDTAINFPITMANSNYYINGHVYGNTDQNVNWIKFGTRTTTGTTYVTGYGSNTKYALTSIWEAKGKSA